MPIEIWNVRRLLVATLMLGCPAGDDGSAGTEGDTDAATGTTASTAATSPTSAASMSSTSASTSTTTDETTSSDVTGDVSTNTSSPAESSGSEGTTGKLDPCAALGRDECAADASCEPIVCAGYMMSGAGTVEWCLTEPQFIGCRSADLECEMAVTITCEGDDAVIYRCREDCIPEGFILCEPPVDGEAPACMG